MKVTKKLFSSLIKAFNFTELFNFLGWNFLDEQTPVKLKEETYLFNSVAEKGGYRIIVFIPAKHQDLPDYATRLQLDRKIARLFREHLIIFCDKNQTTQVWQLFVKQHGKPSRLSETRWNKGQEPELLYQKTSNLFFTLDDEVDLTISDVVDKVNENFSRNVEQVTKKFYENFRKEHKQFIGFIKGISVIADQEWYASLMLNRLMFCYFIQKKGFLDNNINYLKDKLLLCQQKKGKDQFYVSFYKNFLLALFHQGLGSPLHSEDFTKELGKIPYLNGGLFDVHELEKRYTEIDISDDAFIKVFAFFDQYNWHLDTRVTATGRDINPDVIGYIFEKYINDRAQMGAYYTKEDITDYISKNCIIPFLFDETQRTLRQAQGAAKTETKFSEVWQMLKDSGDEYIYEAVKKGTDLPLPPEIEIGVDTSKPALLERRKDWNKPAPFEFALPTEIWREVVERRKRYFEVKTKIENGEINTINDFITYNLNIRQFAQDVIENTGDPDFLKHFYQALRNITILDPTSGSGAFLFAAMNILETLYEACINRMRGFVEDEDWANHDNKKSFSHKYKFFREVLEEIQHPQHPNLQYYIYKSIILRNLYGVDIMKEAVEIAKLRLFLKLVATVEADYHRSTLNLGIEPLPDIDFNIRAGNTLVGFASLDEAIRAVNSKDKQGQMGLVFEDELDIVNSIKIKADDLARVFKSFKESQLAENLVDRKLAKDKLIQYKTNLNDILNEYHAFLYGIDKKDQYEKFNHWLQSHQPFHWFAEFYEIVHDKGGFDVIIGNPPYVVYSETSFNYKLKDFKTISCSNLYAYCSERSFQIINSNGRFGMIIPNSSISADKLAPLQKLFTNDNKSWISNYSWRPSKLFEGADMLLAIILSSKSEKKKVFSTMYSKWYSDYRGFLFDNLSYNDVSEIFMDGTIPKIPSSRYFQILEKTKFKSGNKNLLGYFKFFHTNHFFYYFRAVQYWVKILEKEPVYLDNGVQTKTGEMKSIYTDNEELKFLFISILSSSAYFIHYITWASCQVINNRDFEFPFYKEALNEDLFEKLVLLGKKIQLDYQQNSQIISRTYSKKGRFFKMEKQHYYIKKSKPIIDEIDKVLAEHYGFTEEELDFIINYDIKYRMGKELEGGEEE